jgi:hypothetical protein
MTNLHWRHSPGEPTLLGVGGDVERSSGREFSKERNNQLDLISARQLAPKAPVSTDP